MKKSYQTCAIAFNLDALFLDVFPDEGYIYACMDGTRSREEATVCTIGKVRRLRYCFLRMSAPVLPSKQEYLPRTQHFLK